MTYIRLSLNREQLGKKIFRFTIHKEYPFRRLVVRTSSKNEKGFFLLLGEAG